MLEAPPAGRLDTYSSAAAMSTFRPTDWIMIAMVAVLSAAALLCRIGEAPIYLFDEARLANNAMEMLARRDPLVTWFDGAPDLYNTKPPLMIWLMAASIWLMGPDEVAIRAPAALAAAATVALVCGFVRAVSGSRSTGFAAGLVLLATAGFVGPHMATSGDYDALLVLFTTIATAAGFFLVEEVAAGGRRDRLWTVVLAAALVGGVLTKGVAGLVVAPGLLLYGLARGVLPRLARRPAVWLAAAGFCVVAAGFYLLREAAAPGYLGAVAYNELTGRAGEALDGHAGPAGYYVAQLVASWPLAPHAAERIWPVHVGSAFPWAWFAPCAAVAARLSSRASCRRAAALLAILSLSFLAVISAMQTKLPWYLGPLYPWVAALIALGAGGLADRLGASRGARARTLALGLTVLIAALGAGVIGARRLREAESAAQVPNGVNGELIRGLPAGPQAPPLRFMNDGYERGAVRPVAEAFYVKAARWRGGEAELVGSGYRPRPGEVVVWCRPNVKAPPRLSGQVIRRTAACEAVRIAARAPARRGAERRS